MAERRDKRTFVLPGVIELLNDQLYQILSVVIQPHSNLIARGQEPWKQHFPHSLANWFMVVSVNVKALSQD